jgi:hypothetical protein
MWKSIKHKSLLGISGRNITSDIDCPVMGDWVFFLMWLHNNRSDMMELFGYQAMLASQQCLATLVEHYVCETIVPAQAEAAPLPLLRGRKDKARNTEPLLRLAFLGKLKIAKFHNNHITRALNRTLLPEGAQQVFEHASVVAYMQKLLTVYKPVNRLHLSMDESNHTEPTMVTAVYSPQNDWAAYAPIVVMQKASMDDLDLDELKQLAADQKLERMPSFNYIKCLQRVLLSLGQDLDTYKLAPEVVARPLKSQEVRIQDPETNKWIIHDAVHNTWTPKLPVSYDWSAVPLLVVWIDQAGTGLASSQYLMEKTGLMMLQYADKFHRARAPYPLR